MTTDASIAICEYLSSGVDKISGVGKVTAELLRRASYCKISDVLFDVPYRYVSRRVIAHSGDFIENASVIANVYVIGHAQRSKIMCVTVDCAGTTIELSFFGGRSKHVSYMLPVGTYKTICGTLTRFGHKWQIAHPEICAIDAAKYEPVYRANMGVNGKILGRLSMVIIGAIKDMGCLYEWNPLIEEMGWMGFVESLRIMHNPMSDSDIKNVDLCRERLAFDEVFAGLVSRQIMRSSRSGSTGSVTVGDDRLCAAVRGRLSFTLTADQEQAVSEIRLDQGSPYKMFRLLLGDVGSGKTIVALLAMLNAVESGKQAALLVPTEMLAYQHFNRITALLQDLGVSVALLLSKTKTKERRRIVKEIASGEIDILIGAHAIFQEKIEYADLGLAVIDEQHRFGVEHRQLMVGKGDNVDVLLLSATPIPRSVLMLRYGYMDCSVLAEKPASRGAIKTVLIPSSKIGDVVHRLQVAVYEQGMKAYWICPLIDESESVDLSSVTERFVALRKVFGERVGIVHRRVPSEAKEEAITDFLQGKISVLIATTVVEVGIDVPDVNIIIIEEPHRFGLAQLHQLRGRVARSIESGVCMLLYRDDLESSAVKRLGILRDNDDGFVIAEHDLKIRGGGDLTGYKQSGRLESIFFVPGRHDHLLERARLCARTMAEDSRPDIITRVFSRSVGEHGLDSSAASSKNKKN